MPRVKKIKDKFIAKWGNVSKILTMPAEARNVDDSSPSVCTQNAQNPASPATLQTGVSVVGTASVVSPRSVLWRTRRPRSPPARRGLSLGAAAGAAVPAAAATLAAAALRVTALRLSDVGQGRHLLKMIGRALMLIFTTSKPFLPCNAIGIMLKF